MKAEIEKRAYKIPEFSEAYGIGRTKVFELIKTGQLESFKLGRRTLISRAQAEAWLKKASK